MKSVSIKTINFHFEGAQFYSPVKAAVKNNDVPGSPSRPQSALTLGAARRPVPPARTGLNIYGVPTAIQSVPQSKLNYGVDKENIVDASFGDKIKVCVRKRPLNSKELARNEKDIAEAMSARTIVIHEPKAKVDLTKYIEKHLFVFDHVFDETASNEQIYEKTAYPLVETVFNNGKATCFAYGQTGFYNSFWFLTFCNKEVERLLRCWILSKGFICWQLKIYSGFYESQNISIYQLMCLFMRFIRGSYMICYVSARGSTLEKMVITMLSLLV